MKIPHQWGVGGAEFFFTNGRTDARDVAYDPFSAILRRRPVTKHNRRRCSRP